MGGGGVLFQKDFFQTTPACEEEEGDNIVSLSRRDQAIFLPRDTI